MKHRVERELRGGGYGPWWVVLDGCGDVVAVSATWLDALAIAFASAAEPCS